MNVYVENSKLKDYLNHHKVDGITVLDEPENAHFFITGRYDDLKYQTALKGILIPYTGHNGIDLEALRRKNLMLFITPTRSRYVAEKAVTMTLALLGNTIFYHKMLENGNWSSRNSDNRVPWTSIQDLKVGLFGFGRIGKYVHQFLQGFGCSFYTINRKKPYPNELNLVDNLEELIESSDVIIISAPLNETTEGLFDQTILSTMKDKFLINVGRGKIVEEEALYNSLKNKTLKGYASDVWYHYPKGKEPQQPTIYPIQEFDNVLLSNHSGGFTYNTNDEVNRDILQLLMKFRDENYEDQLDLETLL